MTPRKPKRCQWMSGVCSRNASTWTQCKEPPVFRVWTEQPHLCVGWVCASHATDVIREQLGQLS